MESGLHDDPFASMLSATPVPLDEVARLRALASLKILDTDADPAFDKLVRLATSIFGTSMAFVNFIDSSRVWCKAVVGIEVSYVPREYSFCAHTIQAEEVTFLLDASEDERFCDNPFVLGHPNVRFHAGAPLMTPEGHRVGTFCVIDSVARPSFSAQQQEILKGLAELALDAADIHRRNTELKSKESEARSRYLLVSRATLDGVWDWDIQKDVVFYSPRWQHIMGLPESNVYSELTHWLDRVHPEDRQGVDKTLQTHLRGETARFRSEHRLLHGDGSWRWVMVRGLAQQSASGTSIRMAGSLMDITRDKTSDPLTGLPNRLLLHDRLAHFIRRGEVTGKWNFAVFFLDVDRFKQINDRFGHLAGDAMLQAIASRLEETVSETRMNMASMVARFAGDEFVMLLDGVENSSQARGIAERVHAAVCQPVLCNGETVSIGVSIGMILANAKLVTPESFLHKSDMAMYQAKSVGRGSSVLFSEALQQERLARLELETALRRAVDNEQLRVYYQPQVDLDTGMLVGCEALVRWQHPARGLLTPDAFIAVAEEMRLVSSIDSWVMEEACSQLALWRSLAPGMNLSMSVNVSGHQLARRGLKEAVQGLLDQFCLPASALCLELTESILMGDTEGSIRLMEELRAVGVGLHMDDFGSGYSSFRYLSKLPFDTLKIDRSFLEDLPDDAQAFSVVQSIVDLARTMKLRVIVEGIETLGQMQALQGIGCKFGQGYYFNGPLEAKSFQHTYLRSNS